MSDDNSHEDSPECNEDLTESLITRECESPSDRNASSTENDGPSKQTLWKYIKELVFIQILYIMQGIPVGFTQTAPIILAAHGISYSQQAVFSLASWPYSSKLIIAPIIDGITLNFLGRRKSWLVPLYLIADLLLLVLSARVDGLLASKSVGLLSFIFFLFNCIIAAGDVVVDGWALKLLPKEIIGYASVCNRIGFHSGVLIGFVIFMALESPTFCNMIFRSTPSDVGLVTFSGYLWFWGCVWFATAVIVLLFIKEKAEEEENSGICNTYKLLWKIAKLPAVRSLSIILLTYHIGIGSGDGMISFKLLQLGMSRDRLTLLVAPAIPMRAIFPMLVSRYTTGPESLKLFERCFIPRILFAVLFAVIFWASPMWLFEDKTFPISYFLVFSFVNITYAGLNLFMTLCIMSWFNRVSDPLFGGTYMTLLNTFLELGFQWPYSLALWAVDPLTVKSCESSDGSCKTVVDGYYIEMAICVVLGSLWLLLMRRRLRNIQYLPESDWRPKR